MLIRQKEKVTVGHSRIGPCGNTHLAYFSYRGKYVQGTSGIREVEVHPAVGKV